MPLSMKRTQCTNTKLHETLKYDIKSGTLKPVHADGQQSK